MDDVSSGKIERWRHQIEKCRAEALKQGQDGRAALQSIIASYERLIALVARKVEKP
jgi:hypothetical protein